MLGKKSKKNIVEGLVILPMSYAIVVANSYW